MIKSGATWTNAPVGEIRPVGLKPDLITGPPVLKIVVWAPGRWPTSRTPLAIAASLAGAELVDFAVDDVCDTAEGSGLAA